LGGFFFCFCFSSSFLSGLPWFLAFDPSSNKRDGMEEGESVGVERGGERLGYLQASAGYHL
jgi:hypothetical protein